MIHQVGSFNSKKLALRFIAVFGDLFKVPLEVSQDVTRGALVRRFNVSLDATAYAAASGMAHLSIFQHYLDSMLVTLRSGALSMNVRKDIKRLKKKFPHRYPIK